MRVSAGLLLLGSAYIVVLCGSEPVFDVRDYGAVGDGVTKDTGAIVKAVAAIADAGGGQLHFPAGRYLTAPFNLTSHCTVYLERDATLLGSTDFDDWPVIPALPSYGQGRDHAGPRRSSLLHGQNLTGVRITGANGTIDGQGAVWWADHKSGDERYTRGHLIELMWSSDVEVSNLTLTNSPFWTVHPVYVRGFVARDLTIVHPTDGSAPNTDGIDPDSTQDVLIERCYIRTGDDAIAIKSGWDAYGVRYGAPSRNITIRDCVFSSPCCAAVCIGSEMSGGVADVRVENTRLFDSAEGLRLKAGRGRGGYIRNVSMAGVAMDGMKTAFMYNCNYGGHPAGGYNASALPDVGDIAVSDVNGTNCGQVADLEGLAELPMHGIRFDDVRFDGGGYKCSQVSGSYRDMQPQPCSALAPARD